MTPRAVEARGLRLVHPSGRTGLDGVALDVEPGERVVVLGPNGSGKTTLLRVVGTALRPDAGELSLFGLPVPPVSPSLRRRLGVLPDRVAHLEPLDGRENALLFARAAGVPAREAAPRVERLFERLALTGAADDPVGSWSLGMRRKLLLAEVLVHEPELLVLDEPSLGLDPSGVDALCELLGERAAAGGAVVAALNDPVVAARLADRVVLLDAGRVVADASPDDLLAEVGAGLRCELALDGAAGRAAPSLGALDGVRIEATDGAHLRLRLDRGPDALPAVVSALVDGGLGIRSLRLREPDLGDVFRARTGRLLAAEAPP